MNREAIAAALTEDVGSIRALRANIPLTAHSAAYSLEIPLRANFTPAVLLKCVSTGPGQKAPI